MRSAITQKITQKALLIIVAAFSFSVLYGLQQPQTASAFNNRADGLRLIDEYKADCRYYRAGARPDRTAQDRRCNKVQKALIRDAGCSFTDNRDSETSACLRKINDKFGSDADIGPSDSDNDPALDCIDHPDRCDLIKKYINPIIGFLSAAVGIAVTIGIVSGGIRYAGAADDPQKMNAAKNQISGAIVALIAYIFLYLLLKWLAPGV